MESDRSISAPTDGVNDGIQRLRPPHGRTSGPARRSTKGQWTAEEDEILRKAVQRFKGKNWKKIAECFKDRTDVQCLHRWQKVLNPELVKGPWSKEEDEIIIELVNKFGPKKWSTIAQHLPGRIGKQCRERWHNHLNPAINKEAWTQQEELTLIRAHQIFGNRWAELTKFLPGRTDNSIKNHWNSSVKKKLESYLASGLLEQFQGLPLVGHQSQSVPSPSSRVQSSGEDSGPNCGTEAEEISECSQESTVVGHSQSASDLANAVLQTREEFQFTEDSGLAKGQSSSSASFPEQYLASIGDITISIPENFFQQNFSNNAVNSASGDYQYNLQELPSISPLELRREPSGLPTHCIAANESQDPVNVPFQTDMTLSASTSLGDIEPSSSGPGPVLLSDDECCKLLFSEEMNDGIVSSTSGTKDSNMNELIGCTDTLLHRSMNIQISENDRPSAAEPYCPSNILGISCGQLFLSDPLLLSFDDNVALYGREPNQIIGHSFENQQEFVSNLHDGFIYTNDAANSSGDDDKDLQEQAYLKEDSELVPMNSLPSGTDTKESCPVDKKSNVHIQQQDTGALCYEPPCFPGLDIPFLSCELIQSGSDMQIEYSPLGIRQLMMSSMNSISPFRLWDSPSRDASPDAVLKSAAKTFTNTPSILKKRNRDLLSPLSDRKCDKKLEIDTTSNLTKEFSRLDVLFDENATHRASLPSSSSYERDHGSSASSEDKENRDPALEGEQENRKNSSASENRILEGDFVNNSNRDNTKQQIGDSSNKTNFSPDTGAQNVKQPSVVPEDNLSDLLLFSPDQVGLSERAFAPSARTPRNLYRRILGTLSEKAVALESSPGKHCLECSPTVCGKNHDRHLISDTSVQSALSAPSANMVDNTGNDAGIEHPSVFGVTPFKRSIESPSSWKSPWFINSFVPGPRVDTDISIEDIGYFMSPGDRSYDAIALMQQLSEHTASAYADALEVLGNETPESLLRDKRHFNNQRMDQENNHAKNNQNESRSSECRILDFSECETPSKGRENGKSATGVNFSSPSSYLLKACR